MRSYTKEIVIVCILILIIIIRGFYFLPTPPDKFYKSVGSSVTFTAQVSDYPDTRDTQVRYTVTPVGADFNIIVPVYKDNESFKYKYGDVVSVEGVLTLPENFITNTGREFDYIKYLKVYDTFFIIKNAKIDKLEEGGSRLKKGLFFIRNKFEGSLFNILPMRDAGFLDGLLLGAKGGISNEDKEIFVTTGTIHIVALSGYNVMVVAEAVMRTIGLVVYGTIAYVSAGIAILLFVLMAGASATAVRAGAMAVIALLARSTGRTYDALRALLFVCLAMLVYNPLSIFDVSFHLSVLATFGIIMVPVKVMKYFMWVPNFKGFREVIVSTVSASIMVVPYIMYVMGSFSVVSLFANALILPFIPYIMLLGFIAGSTALLSNTLALPFSYVTHLGSAYTFKVTEIFASLPYANLNITKLPLIILVVIYILIVWWVFKKSTEHEIASLKKHV